MTDSAGRAPVVVFAYNRPEHLRATLIALAACPEAAQTRLIVYADGPKSDADRPRVHAVRDVLACAQSGPSTAGFASVEIRASDRNKGLAASIIGGVTETLAESERVIVLEDDLMVAPGFLDYMNRGLAAYAKHPAVFSLSGYCAPPHRFNIPKDFTDSLFFIRRCASWSWATWKDRWKRIDWTVADFDAFIADEDARRDFDRGGEDLTEHLLLWKQGLIDVWAIRFCYAHWKNRALCGHPVRSLVRNIGHDDSGANCRSRTAADFHIELDPDFRVESFPPNPAERPDILAAYARVYAKPWKSKLKKAILRLWKP